MALKPSTKYPGQIIITDPGYPLGRARNESAPGARNGTPLEEAWVNDLFGWQQALLAAAGLVATEVPDKVGGSQYLDAIKYVATHTPFADGIQMTGGAAVLTGTASVSGLLTASGGIYAPGNVGATLTGPITLAGATSIAGGLTVDTIDVDTGFTELPPLSPAISVRRVQAIVPILTTSTDGQPGDDRSWYFNASQLWWEKRAGGFSSYSVDSTLTTQLNNVPDNSTLTQLRFYVRGSGATALPSPKPRCHFFYLDQNGAANFTEAYVEDNTSTLSAYNQPHVVTLTLASPLAIDHTNAPKRLYAMFESKAQGAGPNLMILGLVGVFTCSKLSPG